jgi:hypothetical protein
VNILDRFSKNPQITSFIKIRPVRAEFFNADGQIVVAEPIAFQNLRTLLKIQAAKTVEREISCRRKKRDSLQHCKASV